MYLCMYVCMCMCMCVFIYNLTCLTYENWLVSNAIRISGRTQSSEAHHCFQVMGYVSSARYVGCRGSWALTHPGQQENPSLANRKNQEVLNFTSLFSKPLSYLHYIIIFTIVWWFQMMFPSFLVPTADEGQDLLGDGAALAVHRSAARKVVGHRAIVASEKRRSENEQSSILTVKKNVCLWAKKKLQSESSFRVFLTTRL